MSQLYDNKTKTVLNWSSGKDAAYAYYLMQQHGGYDVTHLLTTINAEKNKVVMHGVREELLDKQAAAMGLPLKKIHLPASPADGLYKRAMETALNELKETGVAAASFGDIFLEDLKKYRESQLAKAGLECVFPLWKIDTRSIIKQLEQAGIEAIIVCVNGNVLDKSFLGRKVNTELLNDLPGNVDPCGENGEFHTFVYKAPYFSADIAYEIGDIVKTSYDDPGREEGKIDFFFLDVFPLP